MATKRKTAAEIREEEVVKEQEEILRSAQDDREEAQDDSEEEEILRSAQDDRRGAQDDSDKDAEIARLKAELAEAKKVNVSEVFVPNGRGDAERIQRLATQVAQDGGNAWQTFVKVRVPRKMGAGDDDFWISVNGVSAQIPANGEVQEMKLPYAMALMESLEAEEKAIEFAEGLQLYDPVTNPKPMG